MRILQVNIKLLTICGCWRPDSWSSMHKRIAYYLYSIIIALFLHTFMLSQLMDVILTVDNADDLVDNFFVLISMIASCCKFFILLINRKNIIMLINILEKPCKPIRSTEINILYKFDKSIQINSWRYISLAIVTILCIVLSSLTINFRSRKLTYKAWLPFDYSSTLLFYLMYTHQLISFIIAGFLSIGCDTLICGLLVHICCQIEILTYRLRKIISYADALRDCVRQHYRIFRLAFIVNTKFKLTITIQFILSTLAVCFCLYQINNSTTKIKCIEMILFMFCMLTQSFFYCWYGNELKIKSYQMIDNIFEMEWLTLDNSKKKSLMIIMRRSLVPIQITCAYIIPMNLNSFMGILKMSYSTYNLLQNKRV